ncbi:MAG: hypothetical protein ACR2KT_01470 [Methylocella sp.]|nr:MAG: hypothetical protein DLM68_01990 [Hyphomicrobiales bacterium]
MTNRVFTTLAASAVAMLTVIAPACSTEQDDKLQNRYRLCINKAESDLLEAFRSSCDVLCIREKREPASCADQIQSTSDCCLAHHFNWDTANCSPPISETERQDQQIEKDKDRCLEEFKAGVTEWE